MKKVVLIEEHLVGNGLLVCRNLGGFADIFCLSRDMFLDSSTADELCKQVGQKITLIFDEECKVITTEDYASGVESLRLQLKQGLINTIEKASKEKLKNYFRTYMEDIDTISAEEVLKRFRIIGPM